jgi:hypothetical protein
MSNNKKDAVAKIINRHMARLLSGLSEINAPMLIIQSVKTALLWMQADIAKEIESD